MRNTHSGFSIVDLLIIVALLMIVLGVFGPHVSKYMNKPKPAPSHVEVVHPVH